jgi:hypothetical protein
MAEAGFQNKTMTKRQRQQHGLRTFNEHPRSTLQVPYYTLASKKQARFPEIKDSYGIQSKTRKSYSLPLNDNTLVLTGTDVLERPLEMTLRPIEAGIRFVLGRVQVRVDELDKPVEVLCRDGFVLLVEVVDVAVEDLHEELDGDGCVHAGVGDAEGSLETF